MNRVPNPLIAELAADLEPVRPLKLIHGIVLVTLAAAVTVVAVEAIDGLWRGVFAGRAAPFFFVTNGMLAILGAAASLAVVRMGTPHVGNTHDGARWSFVMLVLLPITAGMILLSQGSFAQVLHDQYGVECFVSGTAFGLITAATLTMWLRRGAPVSINSAGWYTGIASGAIGSVAFGLACPIDTVGHLGIWHVAPVAVSAIIGRLVVPSLVRW